MPDKYPRFKAAVVQAAPVFLNREATIEKACRLILEAGKQGASLVAFPEVFVPGYPYWVWLELPHKQGAWHRRLFKEAVEIPSPATEKLCQAAMAANVHVVIGVNEKIATNMGALWNTNLVIDSRGVILGKCRKLVPTRAEKMVWANGDGASLKVFDTDIGKLGTLACGTNANPLARFALLAQGEQVHVANYPAFPGFIHEIEIRSRAHSHEGRVFTITSNSTMSPEIIDMLGKSEGQKNWLNHCKAYSAIHGPRAEALAELRGDEEGIIYADIDIEDEIEPKQALDITGHTTRLDVLSLNLTTGEDTAVNPHAREPAIGNKDLTPNLNREYQAWLEKNLEELKQTSGLLRQWLKRASPDEDQ